MDYLQYFLFGIYPYICLATFFLGSVLRFNKDQKGWKSDSSQLLAKRALRWGNNLFHIGIIMLFVGHFVGFFTPLSVLHAIGIDPPLKQMLAIVLGAIAGSLAFVGLVILIIRRLSIPRIRKTSKPMDIVLLFWVLIVLSLGLYSILFSVKHPDGSMIVRFMNWAQAIVTLRGDAVGFILDTPWIYKAHIVLAFTLFLIFPFTRLVHIWSGIASVFSYLFRRPQIVRKR